MAVEPIIDLADALVTELTTEVGDDATGGIQRVYVPHVDKRDLENLRIDVLITPDIVVNPSSRRGDREEMTLAIGFRKAIPGTDTSGQKRPGASALNNNTVIDAVLDVVRTVKKLWSEDGRLRNTTLSGQEFLRLEHPALYDQDDLINLGILTSVVRVTYLRATEFS